MSELRVDTITDELGTGSPDFPNGITVSNGVFDTSTITASTIDDGAITGGTIDGATIGGTTAGAGTFTTASADSVTTPLVTNAGTLDLSATGSNIITASTAGAERMRITSAGNVGIGTTAPQNRLDIQNGNIKQLTAFGSANKYGFKYIGFGSNFSNPTINLFTASFDGLAAIIRVTVFQSVGGSTNGNVHVGYAYYFTSGSTTTMSVQGGFGVQNVGTLSWNGSTLQYTANRVANYDTYQVLVEIGGNGVVSAW